MRLPWPFVGRAAPMETVLNAVREESSAGIVVAGDSGVGKTRLVLEVIACLEQNGSRVVRADVPGTEIPLGAFAHLLPAETAGDAASNPLGSVASQLPLSGTPVLVVDDAHLLDATSAALVHHVVVHGKAHLLATWQSGEQVPGAIRMLWMNGLVDRVDLAPLTPDETTELLERALGEQVESPTALRLWRAATGNPLLLRELVSVGLTTGALRTTHDIWTWQGELLPASVTLPDLIESGPGRLDGVERDVLEFLAFGEPLDVDHLVALTSAEALIRAEDSRLITATSDNGHLRLRLTHPVHSAVVRAQTGMLRARERLRALADTVPSVDELEPDELLRLAVWRLDSGSATDPAILSRACQLARARHDAELAVRLGRAAVDAGADADAVARLGLALYFTGRYDEAEERLRPALARADTDRARAMCGVARAFNLGWGLGHDAAAREMLDELLQRVRQPEWRQALLAQQAASCFYRASLRDAVSHVEQARAIGEPDPRSAARLAAVEALVLGHRGQCAKAISTTNDALRNAAAWAEDGPGTVLAHHYARTVSAIVMGDLTTAHTFVDRARHDYADGSLDIGVSTFAALRAQLCRLRGRTMDAIRWGREAVARVSGRAPGFSGLCRGELAHALALSGNARAAEELLDEVAAEQNPAMYATEFPAAMARTWALAAKGEVADAVDNALATAGAAEAHELYGYCLFSLHDVVRLGKADLVVDRLGRLEGRVDGAFVSLAVRHAAGSAIGSELDAVAGELERLDLNLLAAEASAGAAAAYRRSGEARAEHAAGTRAWMLARQCQGARTPALHPVFLPGLTPRQWQVAQLAAEGLRNREIAEQLVISTRTAANHLCAVYDRLGVNSRNQLAAVLRELGHSREIGIELVT